MLFSSWLEVCFIEEIKRIGKKPASVRFQGVSFWSLTFKFSEDIEQIVNPLMTLDFLCQSWAISANKSLGFTHNINDTLVLGRVKKTKPSQVITTIIWPSTNLFFKNWWLLFGMTFILSLNKLESYHK
jgi:hypothetical protein